MSGKSKCNMRKKIAAGNWKMNLSYQEAETLVKNLLNEEIPDDVHVILAVPYVYLSPLSTVIGDNGSIKLAAQNCYHLEKGAYTGEVSVEMLKSLGIEYVVVGHSERRQYFGETDEMLKTKVDLLLSANMTPIFCCGEPLEIREANGQNGYVSQQLIHSLFHLSAEDMGKVIIAYEPIWAIGTGKTASPQQAQEMHNFLRVIISEKYGAEIGNALSILYGGSVKASNAVELFSQEDVDGGLVGGASLDSNGFGQIIRSF